MVIIQLVLADWPVSIIETASVLVKRKLYTCTYSYMISIFIFFVRVNTIIYSLKCYLCLHDLSYCRIHVPINQMVQRSLWFIIWGGEMVQYEHDLNYRHCTLYISKFKKTLDTMKKKNTHWKNVELTWKCSNNTVICISYASETSSTLVNKLVEQVSQASLTSLARLVEPAWLV